MKVYVVKDENGDIWGAFSSEAKVFEYYEHIGYGYGNPEFPFGFFEVCVFNVDAI